MRARACSCPRSGALRARRACRATEKVEVVGPVGERRVERECRRRGGESLVGLLVVFPLPKKSGFVSVLKEALV